LGLINRFISEKPKHSTEEKQTQQFFHSRLIFYIKTLRF